MSLCLAWGLLLVTAGAALGLSGFASPTPAVNAQYPDSAAFSGRPPVVSTLGNVTRDFDRDPKAGRTVARQAARAVLSTAGLGARQSGSVLLLLAGIGVLSVGGVLRWRRGRDQI